MLRSRHIGRCRVEIFQMPTPQIEHLPHQWTRCIQKAPVLIPDIGTDSLIQIGGLTYIEQSIGTWEVKNFSRHYKHIDARLLGDATSGVRGEVAASPMAWNIWGSMPGRRKEEHVDIVEAKEG